MSQIEALLGPILIQILRHHYMAPRRRHPAAYFMIFLSALSGAAGIVLLFMAWRAWLGTALPPVQALTATGVSILLFSALTAVAGRAMRRRTSRHQAQTHEQAVKRALDDLSGIFGADFEKCIHEYPKAVVVAAALAGVILGRKLH